MCQQHRTRKSSRLVGYDYSSNGYYFVTICTKDRIDYFGEIRKGIMGLNEMGCIVAQCWINIPNHFPNVKLDEWVIMPNHVHGILAIKNPVIDVWHNPNVGADDYPPLQRVAITNPSFRQSRNLPSIMRGFKIGVTKYARQNNIDFAWQRSYYDHIIRNNESLNRIRQYIRSNPAQWERDRNNKNNTSDTRTIF